MGAYRYCEAVGCGRGMNRPKPSECVTGQQVCRACGHVNTTNHAQDELAQWLDEMAAALNLLEP